MLPDFLLAETVARQDGTGPAIDVGNAAGKSVLLTLGITRIIEQESLDIAVYGSADGQTWSEKPIITFPQKFYCGVYTLVLDLSGNPDTRYLRVQWKMNRWGRGEPTPLFGFYVFVQEAGSMVARAVA